MNREKMIRDIAEYNLCAVYHTSCEECNKEESIEGCGDEEEAAEAFYNDGYRLIDNRMICKECRKNPPPQGLK